MCASVVQPSPEQSHARPVQRLLRRCLRLKASPMMRTTILSLGFNTWSLIQPMQCVCVYACRRPTFWLCSMPREMLGSLCLGLQAFCAPTSARHMCTYVDLRLSLIRSSITCAHARVSACHLHGRWIGDIMILWAWQQVFLYSSYGGWRRMCLAACRIHMGSFVLRVHMA